MPLLDRTGAGRSSRRLSAGLLAAWASVALVACGGGSGGSGETPAPPPPTTGGSPTPAPAPATMSVRDATRLADQASFGPTESLVATIRSQGAATWVHNQMGLATSSYTSGAGDAIHKNINSTFFCDQPANNTPTCWRDNFSSEPLSWDFYRNAMSGSDQLRQRVAFALGQLLVVSGVDIESTYGMRNYHNALLQNAFGNYRQVLKKVTLSPVMGDYLNNVNNDKAAPNENFARELLQLFSIGTCELNADGTMKGGTCTPTYNNDTVRAYAYALTGWTYPAGGSAAWGCWPTGANCTYHGGDMVPVARYHDTAERKLLSGVTLATGHEAAAALERVLDSLMAHANTPPYVAKHLIKQLVTSNPSPAYVGRVASAFANGTYTSDGRTFGTGQRGDLAATVAAVLLDTEARGDAPARTAGKLREPVLMFTGVLRALNGRTDGYALGWWWGQELRQHAFRPPSVFNFYPAEFPVAGTSLVGPSFGLHNANTALQRMNFLVYLLEWNGSNANSTIPGATGTKVDLSGFVADAPDAAKLVDRLSVIATGTTLPAASRSKIIEAVSWWTSSTDSANWQTNRVKTAAFLVFASPQYAVQR